MDTEDEKLLKEEGITGEEEEDEEEERNEEKGIQEGNKKDQLVSNNGIEYSISVVASGHARGS
jgi:hypothetical protein